LTKKSSGQESLQQILSAAHSPIRDILQQGGINQGQALPTIASLNPDLPNFQPHHDLQLRNLTHHQAAHGNPALYYQQQQSESWHLAMISLTNK
jgi:hypothetical protein